jgi:putative sigma-54 modulation protein
MKILIEAVNFNIDKGLKSFIEKKINSLERFYDRIIEVEVYLKVQKTSDKENKIIEIRVFIPGEDVVVKKTAKTFEEGLSLSVEALKRSLKKVKEKQRSH